MQAVRAIFVFIMLAVGAVPAAHATGVLARTEARFHALADGRSSGAEAGRMLELLNAVAVHARDDYIEALGVDYLDQAALTGLAALPPAQPATPADLFKASADAMLKALDPHSSYLSPAEYNDMKTQVAGRFGGVGVQITMEGSRVKVVAPLEGTPAYRAGLQPGDIITHIDGESTEGWSLVQVVRKMRGDVGTPVRLGVERQARRFEVTLTREIISIQSVRWRLEGRIGYIRISAFPEDAPAKVAAAIGGLRAAAPSGLAGIVIDLRGSPGGLLSSATAVSDHFAEQGTIIATRGRTGDGQVFRATAGDLSRGLPLAVLIDQGTASAAEIMTLALRSLRRAVIIGTRSFGKGSVQTLFPLSDGGALKLTTARYYSDLGTTYDGVGVEPDIVVAAKASDNDDPALRMAISTLSKPAPVGGNLARQSEALAFPKGAPRPDDIAVVIGNADYGRLGRDLPDVVPAYADADGIKRYAIQALGIREGNVIDLRDATGSQMARVFGTDSNYRGQLFDWVRPGKSRVFIYFAGHGAPGGQDGTAYLIPSDADASRIDLNGFPLSTLYANLARLPAESVTVVLEACFSGNSQSGAVIAKASAIYVRPKTPAIPRNITVVTAGGPDQIASWEENGSHSLFTKYFLKAMAGEADRSPYGDGDGRVGWKELDLYLKDTLTYYARRYYGRDQTARIINGN